jgi:hypothetical protein
VEVHQCGAGDVRALLLRVPPREARHAVLDRQLHQAVIRRMVLDVVDAMAEPVVRPQRRALRVRGDAERHRLAAGDRTVGDDLCFRPPASFARERLAQRDVGGVRVVRRQRRWLVLDVVGSEAVGDGHGGVRTLYDFASCCCFRQHRSMTRTRFQRRRPG